MVMWLRLGGALLVTLAVMACLEYSGVGSLLSGRSADEVQHDAQNRARELFWLMIFGVVMTMSVVAAVRRWTGQLRRHVVLTPPQLRRRDVG
jgi:hypothetical protein